MKTTNTTRIIIADELPFFRDGLTALFTKHPEFAIVGEAENGRALVELAKKTPCDLYIIDRTMPLLNGLDAARQIIKHNSEAKIILLSSNHPSEIIRQAVEIGVKGFLDKSTNSEKLLKAITEIIKGGNVFSPTIITASAGRIKNAKRGKNGAMISTIRLTIREREILQLIAEGYSGKEIAKKLGLALNTVHVHRNNLMCKTSIRKQTDLVRYAIREGVVKA